MRRYEADTRWLEELSELLRIASVSSDPAHEQDVRDAADWVAAFVRRAGGEASVIPTAGHPLVIGEVAASSGRARAPTVMLYGHFDVQPVGDLDSWSSPPFEPVVRDDWLYARGATDDKGNLYMLLKATEQLARERRLPVNVLVACDGEEECGGDSIGNYIEREAAPVDAAVLFDGPMPAHDMLAFKVATRGLIYFHVTVRSGRRDLHSGMYGGAALNALDALISALEAVRSLPPQLRGGVVSPSEAELSDWAKLPPAAEVLAEQGARARDSAATSEFYRRTMAETSLELHGIRGGEAALTKTIIPAFAEASFSIRLVPGQETEEIIAACESLLRGAAPAGAELELEVRSATPASVTDPASPVIQLGLAAFERAVGQRPLLMRSGGTVPVRSALASRRIPTIHTGFDVPGGNAHAADERLYLPYLGAGIAAARELLQALGKLQDLR